MKIAIFNAYQEKVERGAERFVEEICKRFEKNYSVTIFTQKVRPLRRWPVVWRLYLDPPGLFILWFTLKRLLVVLKEKYDVVIPVNGGWQPALLRIGTWLYGGKMIISGQSGMGWDDRNNLWCFPDAFAALSSHALKWARKTNPFITKIVYIPNGVDTEKFNPFGPKFNIHLKKPIILSVGALIKTKRIDLTIKAVAKMKNASLLLVGQGDMRVKFEELGKRLLNDRFKIINLSSSEINKVYRSCDLFTLVSEPYYSFEIVIAEAMATNLAVVVNDDPIRREIVGGAGLFTDPTDLDLYVKTLQRALNFNWGMKPRDRAKDFSWDFISDKYQNLIEILFK